MSRQFKQRLVMSSLGICGFAFCLYYSYTPFLKILFFLLCLGVVGVALGEYYQLARNKGFQPLLVFGMGCTLFYLLALFVSLQYTAISEFPSLVLLISLLTLFLLFFKQHVAPLGNMAITLFGIGYLVIPLSCALRINYFFPPHALEDGRLWLTYGLLISKMTDIGAYFCGKSFGKTKLASSLSPKKTVEGAIGGLGTALVTSILFAFFASHATFFHMTFTQSLWVGILLSILAQLGDLAESLLKRDAGVKDSSHLPGLGGILDIVDSLVFTLPLLYLLLQMHIVG